MTDEEPKTTGWEKADKAAHTAGKVIDGTASAAVKIYGVILIIIGIGILVLAFATGWWVGLILIAYGIYLLAPGSKLVIW